MHAPMPSMASRWSQHMVFRGTLSRGARRKPSTRMNRARPEGAFFGAAPHPEKAKHHAIGEGETLCERLVHVGRDPGRGRAGFVRAQKPQAAGASAMLASTKSGLHSAKGSARLGRSAKSRLSSARCKVCLGQIWVWFQQHGGAARPPLAPAATESWLHSTRPGGADVGQDRAALGWNQSLLGW